MLRTIIDHIRSAPEELRLPSAAREQRQRDRMGLARDDPGIERVVDEGLAWLCRAQDRTASRDRGVARDFSLLTGWSTSYPETTGYIVPTFIDCGKRFRRPELLSRAREMLDWLVGIQLPGGGFQGGRIDATPIVPVTFNTGQILLGLAAGQSAFGGYAEPMHRAADWLVATLDADGGWRRHPTPFAAVGEKTYETHVAWGLLEAARVAPQSPSYAAAALANVRWAIGKQRANGWFDDCCLSDRSRPLTHTIGYAIRGILEAYRFSRDEIFLESARRAADPLVDALGDDGRLPGQFSSDWQPAASWTCLTGSVQIAYCWLMIYRYTGDKRYRDAAFLANRFVRRTIAISGPDETRGAVKGSHPIDGTYGRYQYLNWAVKFSIDAQLLEHDVRALDESPGRLPAVD